MVTPPPCWSLSPRQRSRGPRDHSRPKPSACRAKSRRDANGPPASVSSVGLPISTTRPLFEDDDPVGPLDGPEAMSDHERRAIAHQPFQRLGHLGLGPRVECRCGLVENEDPRIAGDGARYSQPLPLTPREAGSAFAEHGVEPGRRGLVAHPPAGGHLRPGPFAPPGGGDVLEVLAQVDGPQVRVSRTAAGRAGRRRWRSAAPRRARIATRPSSAPRSCVVDARGRPPRGGPTMRARRARPRPAPMQGPGRPAEAE